MSARKGDYRRTDDGETGLAGRAPLPEGRSMDLDLEAEREERRKATSGKFNRGDYRGHDEGSRGQRSPSPARLDRFQGGGGRSGPSQNDDRRNDYSRDGASTSKSKGNYTGRSTSTIYSDNRRRDDDRRQNDSRNLDRDRNRNDNRDISRDRDRERNNRIGEDKFSKQRQQLSTSANSATTRGDPRKPEDMPSREGTTRRFWDSKDSSNISLGGSDSKGKEREIAGSGGDRDTQGQSKKPRLDDTPSTPSIAAEKRDSASNTATGKAKGIYVRPEDRNERGALTQDALDRIRAGRRGRDGSPPRTGSSSSSFRNPQRQGRVPRRELSRSPSPYRTASYSPPADVPYRRSASPASSIRSGRGRPNGSSRRQDDRSIARDGDRRNRQASGPDYRGRSRSRSPANSNFASSYVAGQKRQRSPSMNHTGVSDMRSGSISGMRIASPPRPERAASKEVDDAWANYQPTGQVQASPPGRQMYDMSEAPGYTPNLQPPAFYRPPSEQPPPHFPPFSQQAYQPTDNQNYRSPPLPFPPAFPPHMSQQQSQAQPYQQPPPNFPFQQSPPHPAQLTGLPFLPPGIPLPPPPHLLQQEVTRQLALGIRAPPPGPNRTAGGKFRPVAGLPAPPPGANDSLRRFFPGESEDGSVPGTPVTQQNGLGQDLNRNRMDVDQSPRAPPISPFNKQLANAGLPTPPHIAFPQQYQQPPLPPRHQPQQPHQASPHMAQFLQHQQQQQGTSQQATISPEPRPIILPSAHSPIFPGLSSAPAAAPSTSSTPAGLPPRPTFSSGLLPPFLPPKPNFQSNSQAVSPTLPHPPLPNASPSTSTSASEKPNLPAVPAAAAVFAVPQSPAPTQQKEESAPTPAAIVQDTPGTPRVHALVQSKTMESPSQPSPGPADSSTAILPFEAAETPQPTLAASSSAPVSRGTRELYERIAQVGEGTYGKVYKARNVETNTLVAMKRIRMEAEKDGFPVTAVREIKLLQSLDHGNVVALREMMVSKGHVYMVFEYVDHDLTGILHHPNISFTLGNLKSLMEQLLQGLDYIHLRGVLHRDLKGSNILLSKTGELKIADFGLAKFYAKGKKNDYTNRVITQWYKPPELLFGATVYGPDVDMWSAGCIFLELFTKRPVFQGQDEIHQLDVIYKHMGTPTTSTWPELADLPWYELVKPKKEIKSNFRVTFGAEYMKSPAALDLAEALLSFNPALRPTAKEALTYPYFVTEEPKAERPTWLADIKGDWHEMESKEASRRKGREIRKAQQQQQQQAQKDQHAKEQQLKQAQDVQ